MEPLDRSGAAAKRAERRNFLVLPTSGAFEVALSFGVGPAGVPMEAEVAEEPEHDDLPPKIAMIVAPNVAEADVARSCDRFAFGN
jgi:hypothetical protein